MTYKTKDKAATRENPKAKAAGAGVEAPVQHKPEESGGSNPNGSGNTKNGSGGSNPNGSGN